MFLHFLLITRPTSCIEQSSAHKEKEVLVWERWVSTLTFRDNTFHSKAYLQKVQTIECLTESNRRQFVQQNNSHKKGANVLMDKVSEYVMPIFWLLLLMLVALSFAVILALASSLTGLMHLLKKLKAGLAYLKTSIWKTACGTLGWIRTTFGKVLSLIAGLFNISNF